MRNPIFIAVLLPAVFAAKAQTRDITGLWEGKVNPGVVLRQNALQYNSSLDRRTKGRDRL